jgi:endoglucanase
VTPVSAIDTTNPWLIGAAHWLTSPHSKDLPQFSQTLQTQLLQQASSLVVSNPAEPKMQWLVRYGKASNRVILDDIALLLSAYRLTNDARYRDSAVARIHTLFGLNPLGQSYVTGIGTKPVSFPANMLVQATDKMIPGLLVDGPNANPSDGLTPSGIGASSYADRYKATSSNATSLLNTAALAQALGMLNVSFGNTQSNIKE